MNMTSSDMQTEILTLLACCRVTIPELNPEMDVFRVGTLLEMVREMAVGLAQDGQRVKVSVQQAMGQGVFQVCHKSTSPLSNANFFRHASGSKILSIARCYNVELLVARQHSRIVSADACPKKLTIPAASFLHLSDSIMHGCMLPPF